MTQEVHSIALEDTQSRYSTTDFYTTAVLISQDFDIAGVTDEGHQGKVLCRVTRPCLCHSPGVYPPGLINGREYWIV